MPGFNYNDASSFANNPAGFNISNMPSGVTQTPPTIPASTVVLNNPFRRAADVSIVGGTVTAVKVNGAQVAGGTGVTVRVPAAGSQNGELPSGNISITYSVVPTSWSWVI